VSSIKINIQKLALLSSKTSPETSSPFISGLNKSRGTEAQVVVQVDQVRNRCMFLNVILILEC